MLYTKKVKKALQIAFDAHKDQVDKTGLPYIYHPFYLATQMETEDSIIVALLHDVVEDSPYTFEDLENHGFSTTIIATLRLLTHEDSEDYITYIHRVKENELARIVKLADLKHNSDESRLSHIDDKVRERLNRYAESIEILET